MKNLTVSPIGTTKKKYIIPIIIGAAILFKNRPSFIQNKLNGYKYTGLNTVKVIVINKINEQVINRIFLTK